MLLLDPAIRQQDANELAIKALELAQLSDRSLNYFCVDRNCGRVRWLAEQRLRPLGYPIDWCVESLNKTRQSNSISATTSATGYSSDSSEESSDDETMADPKLISQMEDHWLSRAANWLVNNDAPHDV